MIQSAYNVLCSLTEDGELKRGDREINEGEAAVVRRIFKAYVDGQSPNKIADLLNREGVPGPRGGLWDNPLSMATKSAAPAS